ncbi:hypothetical protein GCM10029978_067250 [Actinoallomurus acanthiterrae]
MLLLPDGTAPVALREINAAGRPVTGDVEVDAAGIIQAAAVRGMRSLQPISEAAMDTVAERALEDLDRVCEAIQRIVTARPFDGDNKDP